jgi:RNA polymerase sigma-70 factor, ECF subfamily
MSEPHEQPFVSRRTIPLAPGMPDDRSLHQLHRGQNASTVSTSEACTPALLTPKGPCIMADSQPIDWSSANHQQLVEMVDELRQIAHRIMRKHGSLTIQPTSLVNEAVIDVGAHAPVETTWERSHLLAQCITKMTWILKDHLRQRSAQKRGGHVAKVALDEWIEPLRNADIDELQFLEVVEELKTVGSEQQFQIVYGKILLGQSIDELSALLEIPRETVERELKQARAYLKQRLQRQEPS